MVIDGLRDEAEPYNYEIVKSYKVRGLERKARKLDRSENALEKMQRERHPAEAVNTGNMLNKISAG